MFTRAAMAQFGPVLGALALASVAMSAPRPSSVRTVGSLNALATLLANGMTADDSVWINQEIQNAITDRRTSYTLPAGTFNLENPIRIPAGAKNFALLGQGSTLTLLSAPTSLKHAIEVGDLDIPYFQYHNYPSVSTPGLAAGVQSIRLSSVAGIEPGYYVLNDDYRLRHKFSGEFSHTRAELVRVLLVNHSSRTVVLDGRTGREFSLNPRLSALGNLASEGIRVQGIGFNAQGEGETNSEGALHARHVSGLTIVDVAVRNFSGHGFRIESCRNVLVANCAVADAAATGPGQGYGVDVSSSRFVTIRDTIGEDVRHTVQLDHGSSDVLIERCQATSALGWNGGFDMHGQDSRRVTIRNCNAPNVNVAHMEWLGGASDVSIEGGRIDFILVGPNTSGLRVVNPTSKWIRFTQWDRQGDPFPATSKIDRIAVQGGVFTYGGVHIDNTELDVTSLSFTNTTFITTSPDRSSVNLTSAKGELSFIGCHFRTGSTEFPLKVSTGTASVNKLKLTVERCRMTSTQPLQYAAQTVAPFRGRISFRTNVISSPRAGARFLNNSAGAPGVISGS